MFFQRIKTPGIAHNAYLLGANGIGIVIDPRRDVEEYLELAAENGLSIKYVLETHRQEDFVLGSTALKEMTGAEIIAGNHEFFAYCDRKLKDGEDIKIEDFRIVALHTPGHTPESMSYAVYLKEQKSCWAVFTGDALFIGEAGRTDLPDKNKTAENAGLLFDGIQKKIRPLGPQTLLYPAHGAGSVCGGNIADFDQSTLGFEFQSNPTFLLSRDEFIKAKMHERIPRPPYFTLMEEINLQGGKKNERSYHAVKILTPAEFRKHCDQGLVIDTRSPEAFAGGHIPGSYSIWTEGLPVFGGWVADKELPLYLVMNDPAEIKQAFTHLTRIGIDNIQGALAGNFEKWRNAGLPVEMSKTISPTELSEELENYQVLDVREINEFEDEGHIAGAQHCYVGSLGEFLKSQELNAPIVVTCSVGHRASLAVSILLKKGYKDVYNLLGGMTAWKKQGLSMHKNEPQSSFYYQNKNSPSQYIEQQLGPSH
jgi:hydroxyacylglutathione hydrolase